MWRSLNTRTAAGSRRAPFSKESSMTTISEAVADAAHLVDGERVHRRAFSDAAVFEQELDRIFGQTWLYVGHESQVPRAGDYVTTQLGRQPVIMCRHQDGKIYVLENRCPHNG